MRDISHLTPAYIYYRFQDMRYRKQFPDNPWLTPKAIDFLESTLQKDYLGLEYGSGRSTTWFSPRIKHLVSVEHNSEWFNRVQETIIKKNLQNISYFHHPKPSENLASDEISQSSYVTASDSLKPDSLDIALVDGIVRPACALRVIPLLKEGGWLILDDANHYLPSISSAPNSRSLEAGPLNHEWEMVELAVSGWGANWFGNGIKETLILQKPE